MIHKINKIKNLGLVFSNYLWNTSLPVFKKFNLIYGWNGSGKTTLTRLFDALGGVSIEGLEYEIEDEQGNQYKQGGPFPNMVRVFNQDYIRSNVNILESRANSISILLGEENKELVEKIENDKKLLEGKNTQKAGDEKEKDRKIEKRNEKYTKIAGTIGATIGGNALRNYRRPQAKKEFSQLTVKAELSEDALQKYSLDIRQDSKPEIVSFLPQKVKLEDRGEEFEVTELLKAVTEEATIILQKTVESEVISRLASHEDISQWVEQGVNLHKKHSSEVCEYCQQKVPAKRTEQLARHFSEADKSLKNALDTLLEKLRKIYSVIESRNSPDKARFYTNLQGRYDVTDAQFVASKNQILKEIKGLAEDLKNKKSKTTESVTLSYKPNIDYVDQIAAVNSLISEHNKTTKEYEKVKNEAIKKIKDHYLSTIYDDVKTLNEAIAKLEETIKSSKKEREEVQKRIAGNLAKISSHHKACEDLNKKLATFLGYQELTFVPHTEKKADEDGVEREVVAGYQIKRTNQLATYLSEGEKTAIAFVYFVVHLGDQDFDSKDGIIVVDDPISSLDSNSLYQAFSFLKHAVKDAGQVFILTHNFDFLKLLINWRRRAGGTGGTGYYMIKNHFRDNARCASIEQMDKELCKYESEYHYLFKLLKQMRDGQDGTIEKAYLVPNIARKVWDTFLLFSVPDGKVPYKKMEELKREGFDAQKLDAINKFTNDQSHITGAGFDPALVLGAKKAVDTLFEMMKEISPRHFKHIDEATKVES